VYLLVFHAYMYINEMHGSRSKILSKNSRQVALRGRITSGVKGLIQGFRIKRVKNEGRGTHSGCHYNMLRSHEFWSRIVPLCLAKRVSE
jgi:hypothetical protein